jgi:protein TonB
MQTCSLFVSMLAHVGLLLAVLVASAMATDVLPLPREVFDFVVVTPQPPPVVPPAPRVNQPPPLRPDIAPVNVPAGIQPERPVPMDSLPAAASSVVPGSFADLVIPDAAAPPPPTRTATAPVRVGGAIQPPRKTVHVAPDYPAIARASRVSGVVILEAVIGEDGTVRDGRILRSRPLLDEAAMDAVRQWRFTPTLLNGQPVPVIMTVTVAFTLN